MTDFAAAGGSDVVTLDCGQCSSGRVEKFRLRNARGVEVEVLSLGAALVGCHVPDAQGRFADVLLGLQDIESLQFGAPFSGYQWGVTVGRYAGQIGFAQFSIDGKSYEVAKNDGLHHMHGGPTGFYGRLFRGAVDSSCRNPRVVLKYESRDGEEGFPGNLSVSVSYELTEDNVLLLDMEAVTDKATPLNLCNHAYWNLAGHDSGDVLKHQLRIHADNYTPFNKELVPTGERIKELTDPALLGGYDHNYALNGHGDGSGLPVEFVPATAAAGVESKGKRTPVAKRSAAASSTGSKSTSGDAGAGAAAAGVGAEFGEPALAAVLRDPVSGRVLELSTTAPGLQLYSSNLLDAGEDTLIGKGGARYPKYAAICMECQSFPNAPNVPAFPCAVLRPGQRFRRRVVHRFRATPPGDDLALCAAVGAAGAASGAGSAGGSASASTAGSSSSASAAPSAERAPLPLAYYCPSY